MNIDKYNKVTVLFIYFSIIYLLSAPMILDLTMPKTEVQHELIVIEKEKPAMTISKVEYIPNLKKEEPVSQPVVEQTLQNQNLLVEPSLNNPPSETINEPVQQQEVDEIKTEQIETQQFEAQQIINDNYVDILLPPTTGFKSYMSYTAITKKSSPQYILQQGCITDPLGLRKINDRYVIAVGTAVGGHIGTYVDLILENGVVIPCVIGDYKAAIHTDATNLVGGNGCASEFLIEKGSLFTPAKQAGDISVCYPEWSSRVVIIRRYDSGVM